MKRNHFILAILLLVYSFIISCESKPKVVDNPPLRDVNPKLNTSQPASIPNMTRNDNQEGHLVVVKEILNTEKYSYLNVSEHKDGYWIAIPRKEVQIGGTYFYKEGLLKKNFESKEYNRIFETIYLVSDIIPYPSNTNGSPTNTTNAVVENINNPEEIPQPEGSISLSELFSHPEEYEGKLIQVTGKCVKVNPMIMGRNWIHIRDGSGEDLDLTITSSQKVNIDDIVSFEGTIALNRDFGAGYKYDIIMEKAIIK